MNPADTPAQRGLYPALVALFPGPFRLRYGAEMVSDFQRESERLAARGYWARLRYCATALSDTSQSLAAEWWRAAPTPIRCAFFLVITVCLIQAVSGYWLSLALGVLMGPFWCAAAFFFLKERPAGNRVRGAGIAAAITVVFLWILCFVNATLQNPLRTYEAEVETFADLAGFASVLVPCLGNRDLKRARRRNAERQCTRKEPWTITRFAYRGWMIACMLLPMACIFVYERSVEPNPNVLPGFTLLAWGIVIDNLIVLWTHDGRDPEKAYLEAD